MQTTHPLSSLLIKAADAKGLPAVTGCPVRADAWDGKAALCLRQADGSIVPVQAVPLTGPTPGGLRWLELSFKATVAGKSDLLLDSPASKPDCRSPSQGGPVMLGNGSVRVRLAGEPGLPPLTVEREQDGAWLPAGVIVPVIETDKGAVHRDDPSAQRVIRVLRDGPLRRQAEVSGQLRDLSGRPSFSYRLTVELWDGFPVVRVDWMLANLVPGVPAFTVKRAALEGAWNTGADSVRRFVQTSYGAHYVPREVRNAAPVALITDFSCAGIHVEDPAMLLDDQVYPRYLSPPTVRTEEWLAVEGNGLALFATLRDFAASRPNRLSSQGRSLNYELIPSGHGVEWPQGRRREQTLLLAVLPEGTPAAAAVPFLSKLWTQGRAVPDPAWLAELRCFEVDRILSGQPGRHIRLSRFMRRLCELATPGDKWNLGDTPETGYTRSYPGIPNHLIFKPGVPALPVSFAGAGNRIYPESFAQFLEPVWTNNEYDIIHGMALEIFRTGDMQPMTQLRWAARHQIEIDFVAFSDDPWHHRASPFHSHYHNTKGAISSHFFTQGLVQYYLLTGDRDALEVVEALGDKIVEIDAHAQARTWKFDREIGWGLLALVCLVEAGLERFRPECDKIAGFLQNYDRAGFKGAVKLSRGREGRPLERQMVDNGFGYAAMVEAMDRYQRITGSPDTAAWLEKLLGQLHREMWNAIDEGEVPSLHDMNTHMLAIGYERTGDPAFIRSGLVMVDAFFDSLAMGGGAADFWGGMKPHGKLYRALIRYLGHADKLGLLDRFEYPSMADARKSRP